MAWHENLGCVSPGTEVVWEQKRIYWMSDVGVVFEFANLESPNHFTPANPLDDTEYPRG